MQSVLLPLYALVLVGMPLVSAHYHIRKLRREGRRFTFGITDYWAALVGLAPFYAILAVSRWTPDLNVPENAIGQYRLVFIFMIGCILLWQITGIFVGRARYILSRTGKRDSRLYSALAIMGGALLAMAALVLLGVAALLVSLLASLLEYLYR